MKDSICGRKTLIKDLKELRNVIFVSTSYTAPTTSSLSWDVEPVRRNSTLHVYINGSQHQITLPVHSVEICFNLLLKLGKYTKALEIFIVVNTDFFLFGGGNEITCWSGLVCIIYMIEICYPFINIFLRAFVK